jgi:hypothetical protein
VNNAATAPRPDKPRTLQLELNIQSIPDGAEVWVLGTNEYLGKTSFHHKFDWREDKPTILVFKLKGYEEITRDVKPTWTGLVHMKPASPALKTRPGSHEREEKEKQEKQEKQENKAEKPPEPVPASIPGAVKDAGAPAKTAASTPTGGMPAPTAPAPAPTTAQEPARPTAGRQPEPARDTHRRTPPPRPKKPSDLVDPFP